jgi:single-stranded-DNA-specific exonuclease
MRKRWRIHSHDADRVRTLEREAGVSSVVAQLLICRGIDDGQQARKFLDCKLTHLREPAGLSGASQAAERIFAASGAGRRIMIYGDYDVDGITGSAILWRCLKLLGADVGCYVPHRIEEGYGLHASALETLYGKGARTVITVDCGISGVEAARKSRELGMELVVTDHHDPGAELPGADVVVHPRMAGSTAYAGLCGSGVAFLLAWEICRCAAGSKKVSEAMKAFLMEAVGLVALGTVADVVPLLDDNRILVKHGLIGLKERPNLGMAALLKLTGLDQKSRLESEDLSFTLAPRLNAAGRLGQAQLAVELLTTSSPDRAAALASYIHELNDQRQSIELSVLRAAGKQAREEFDPENDAALVLCGRGWHPGVIGIVAGKLADKYHRPVAVISMDEMGQRPASGSARSPAGIPLSEVLAACSDLLVSHGGHSAAAGFKIEESRIEAFREEFVEQVSAVSGGPPAAELWIDAEAPLSALTYQSVSQLDQLAPFGQGNTRPRMCATGVRMAGPPKALGGQGRHLSVRVEQEGVGLRAVAFGAGDRLEELAAICGPLSIAFRPKINEFRGMRSVELELDDWQPLEA